MSGPAWGEEGGAPPSRPLRRSSSGRAKKTAICVEGKIERPVGTPRMRRSKIQRAADIRRLRFGLNRHPPVDWGRVYGICEGCVTDCPARRRTVRVAVRATSDRQPVAGRRKRRRNTSTVSAIQFTQLVGVSVQVASGLKRTPGRQKKCDDAARIPLHEAGPAFALANALGGISKKCRVRCGRQAEGFRRRQGPHGDYLQRDAVGPALRLLTVQQRPAPHPTSLREATLSSFVERDSLRIVAHASEMCATVASFVENDSTPYPAQVLLLQEDGALNASTASRPARRLLLAESSHRHGRRRIFADHGVPIGP